MVDIDLNNGDVIDNPNNNPLLHGGNNSLQSTTQERGFGMCTQCC